jgi:hypothetical protein
MLQRDTGKIELAQINQPHFLQQRRAIISLSQPGKHGLGWTGNTDGLSSRALRRLLKFRDHPQTFQDYFQCLNA